VTGGAGPRIAIGIPARNAAGFLPRLLDSIDQQTQPFGDVLVYDDASTDDTGALARSRGARVLRTDTNTGPSIGKNLIARSTDCEWIHFHDADDALRPEFVERASTRIRAGDLDVLLMATEDRDDATGRSLETLLWDDAELTRDAVGYCIRHNVTNCGLYRLRSFVDAGGFDSSDETKFNEDQAMHLRLAIAGLRFGADPYPGTIIYRRAHSMSSGNAVACARAHFHVLRQTAERVGQTHAEDLGQEFWRSARILATYQDWPYVRRALAFARDLGCHDPVAENRRFRAIARVHPFGAVFAREQVIRLIKPHLRVGVPTAR
jgi:glycosyltransferase involved in cell wall biosynthesis